MGCSSFIKNFLNCTILASPMTLLGSGRRVGLGQEGEGHTKFSGSPKGILMLTFTTSLDLSIYKATSHLLFYLQYGLKRTKLLGGGESFLQGSYSGKKIQQVGDSLRIKKTI